MISLGILGALTKMLPRKPSQRSYPSTKQWRFTILGPLIHEVGLVPAELPDLGKDWSGGAQQDELLALLGGTRWTRSLP